MSDPKQYKSFTTRRFRADLHYRLRLLAARLNVSQEEVFTDVVTEGLAVCEQKASAAMGVEGGAIKQ